MTLKTTEIVKLTLQGDDKPIHLRVRSSDARTAERMRGIFASMGRELEVKAPVPEPEGEQ